MVQRVSTHSRPKAAGLIDGQQQGGEKFQLTAARRRLGHGRSFGHIFGGFNSQPPEGGWGLGQSGAGGRDEVSTHSRPKAAGSAIPAYSAAHFRFNSQPPEGGW